MRVEYQFAEDSEFPFAFQINNFWPTTRSVAAMLRATRGVTSVEPRQFWIGDPEILIRFRYREVPFVVWEPYGDSSCWWIGPDDPSPQAPDVSALGAAFEAHEGLLMRAVRAILPRT